MRDEGCVQGGRHGCDSQGFDATPHTGQGPSSGAHRLARLALAGAVVGIGGAVLAQDAEQAEPEEITADELEMAPDAAAAPEDTYRLPGLTIIGSPEAIRDLPGSGHFIDQDEIDRQSYGDINRVLRQAPGVYLREEDGYGLFPNISIRGADPGRSSKTTLMEDGIMIAPAPYSAPAAYFSPTVDRMSGLEVLKGSSQVRSGPHTTGGVVNYLSTPIPDEATGFTRTLYGTNNELRAHGWWGDTIELEDGGRFGYLIEGYFRRTDGFRDFDKTPDFRGGDTGFRNAEPILKLMWEPDSDVYQRLDFKFAYNDREADETYLGLSRDDFRNDAVRRYQASRFDNFRSYQTQTYLRHFIEPTADLDLTTTLYYTQFDRNWYKLHDLRDVGGDADNDMSLSAALAGTDDGRGLGVLRGTEEGTLNVRANNREYYTWGLENVTRYRFRTQAIEHELSVGARYHYDEISRFQWEDRFEQEADGTIVGRTAGVPGEQDDRVAKTDAIALFAQNEMDFGRLTLTPGVRYEFLRQRFVDNREDSRDRGSGHLHMVSGGIGATYDLTDEWTLFGGVHRGFSPPEPQRAVQGGIDEETSTAFELGGRYQHESGAFAGEVAGFATRYDDLLVRDYLGAGGGEDENVGRARVYGLELSLEYDAGIAQGWGFNNPYYVTYTYTRAELRSDTGSAHPESIFSGARRGNRMPYIPDHQLTLGTGLEFDRFGIFGNGTYVDQMYTSASNVRNERDVDGNPDARFGTTDSFFIVDVTAHYWLTDQAKVFGGVQNLFDREYMTTRHPHGPRSGQPFFAYAGLEVNF